MIEQSHKRKNNEDFVDDVLLVINAVVQEQDVFSEAGRPRLNLPDQELLRRFNAGESPQQLSDFYEVSYGTVRNRLKELGIVFKRGPKRPRSKINVGSAEIAHEHNSGMSLGQLAKKYGVTKRAIKYHLLKVDIEDSTH